MQIYRHDVAGRRLYVSVEIKGLHSIHSCLKKYSILIGETPYIECSALSKCLLIKAPVYLLLLCCLQRSFQPRMIRDADSHMNTSCSCVTAQFKKRKAKKAPPFTPTCSSFVFVSTGPASPRFGTVPTGPAKQRSGASWSAPGCWWITCPTPCSEPWTACAATAPSPSARHR